MKNLWCLLVILLLWAGWSAAQNPKIVVYTDGPAYTQSMTNSPGAIQMRTNACMEGWTELTAWAGKMPLATTVAAGDAGTFGGSDTITPTVASLTAAAQTISYPGNVPTISGTTINAITSVINHTHTVTVTYQAQGGTTASTTDTHSMTSTATGGSARSLASGDVVSATTANPSGGVASITPTINAPGTIAWPANPPTNSTSAVTGTLNSFDNRSAWVKVIWCQKS